MTMTLRLIIKTARHFIYNGIYVILFFYFFSIKSQIVHQVQGSESRALGEISSTSLSQWALFNNPSAMEGENTLFIFDASRWYGLDIENIALGYSQGVKDYAWGAGLNYFGNTYLNQSRFFITGSKRINNVRIGLRINLFQVYIQDQKRLLKPYFDLGGLIKLNPKINLGFYVVNFSNTTLKKFKGLLTSFIRLGFAFKLTPKSSVYSEIEKNIQTPINFKIGLKYNIHKNLSLLTGFNTFPLQLHYGFSFGYKKISLAYSVSQHMVLGLVHHVSAITYLKNKRLK